MFEHVTRNRFLDCETKFERCMIAEEHHLMQDAKGREINEVILLPSSGLGGTMVVF